MKYLQDVFHLFFPKICITCESKLLQSEKIICTLCRHDLPIICYKDYKDNKITKAFYGRISIVKANSFLSYRKDGKTKDLIHALKYKGNQEVGYFIGDWFGHVLKESNDFKHSWMYEFKLRRPIEIEVPFEELKNNKPEVLLTLGAGDIDKLVEPIKNILQSL